MLKLLILISAIMLSGCSVLESTKQSKLANFYTDDNYLVLYVLTNTKSSRVSNQNYSQDILNFQNKVWDENKPEYEFLLKNIKRQSRLTYLNFKKDYEAEYLPLIEKSKQLKEFQTLKRQTDIYNTYVSKIWNDQFLKTKNIISELTGLELNKESHIIITHPGLKNGKELNGKWIEWGGYDDPNYNITYLWHEILHQYFDKSNLSHSVIELITDNELNKILTGNDYLSIRGHRQLNPIKKCLMDDWKIYLSSTSKNIMDFVQIKKVTECGELFKNLKW